MATLTVYPQAGGGGANVSTDGYVRRTGVNQTFTNIRTGVGNESDVTGNVIYVELDATATTDQYSDLFRIIFTFDTSALGAGATITGAVLSLYGDSKGNGLGSPDLHIAGATPTTNNNLVDTDYGQCQTTSFGNISYAGFTVGIYNDITLDANGIANISKTGVSKFSAQTSWDINNGFTGVWASGLNSFLGFTTADLATNPPKLVITYSSVTIPTVTTQAVSSINTNTATGNGTVTTDGGSTVSERGVVLSISSSPTIANQKFPASTGGAGAFTAQITGIISNTFYYVRSYAINSIGTAYGSEVTFNTLDPWNYPAKPTVSNYFHIAKPTTLNWNTLNSQGREQYDQADIEYDDPDVYYDGINPSQWTNTAKPL